MALDEALLESVRRLEKPVLRFYGWTEPAASFGYFQKHAEVQRATLLRPLVRRPTGGGIVPHDADWTYSLAFPTGNDWYSLRAEDSYRRVHEWIQAAFARVDVTSELASCCRKAAPEQCFAGHEKSDVLWRGKKIAGAAQRRTRTGLLIQGSVQPPPLGEISPSPPKSSPHPEGPMAREDCGGKATESLAKIDWQQAMCDTAVRDFGVQWSEFELDTLLRERAEALTREKYALAAYNQKQ
jgi:lipoate-protein ligase A